MSSRIEKLPTELLDQILRRARAEYDQDFDSWETQHAYASLCLTSKTLNSLAYPFLYNGFENGWEGSENGPEFILSVCRNPRLAEEVAHIRIWGSRELVNRGYSEQPYTNSELEIMVSKLSAKMSDRKIFSRIAAALADGCYTAQMFVLICAATSLRKLDYYAWPSTEEYHCQHCGEVFRWLRALFSNAQTRDCYARLEEIEIREDYAHPSSTYQDLLPMLRLPALKAFIGDGLRSAHRGQLAPADRSEPSSTLKKIKLEDAKLDTQALQDIVACAKKLTELSVDFTCIRSEELEEEAPSYSTNVSQATRMHQEYLQELRVCGYFDRGAPTRPQIVLGSLIDFSALKSLTLDQCILPGGATWRGIDINAILPPTLENLTLETESSVDDLADICSMLRTFRGHRLSNVSIWLPNIQRDEYVDEMVRRLEEPLGDHDLGCFFFSDDSARRIIFAVQCKQSGMTTTSVLAGLASLLREENREGVIQCLLYEKGVVTMTENKEIAVHATTTAQESAEQTEGSKQSGDVQQVTNPWA